MDLEGTLLFLMALAVFAGVAWLLYRHTRINLAHLMAAVGFYGLILAGLQSVFRTSWWNDFEFVLFAISLAPQIGLGVYVGSRNVLLQPLGGRYGPWLIYLIGLLWPSSLLILAASIYIGYLRFIEGWRCPFDILVVVCFFCAADSLVYAQLLLERERSTRSPSAPIL